MTSFNPARLVLARESLGLTKTQLAADVQITARRLADYENRGECPPPETLAVLARALKTSESFFFAREPAQPSNPSFRSLRSMPASVRDMAMAAASMTIDVAAWIEARLELARPNVPTDLGGIDPAAAAGALREQWGLGLQPAPNLVHLAELMGVRVFALAVKHRTLDAFSFWSGDTPFILINARGTAERRRWDVAHELGHLLLHAGGHHLPNDRGREDEADQFASALLLPAEGIRRDAVRPMHLDEIRTYKLRWKVSAISLIRRLHQLGYLTQWQYRNLVVEASKANLRRSEDDILREASPSLGLVLKELRTRRMGPSTIADQLHLRPADVRNMFHGLAPVDLGGDEGGVELGTASRSLRVVNAATDRHAREVE